MDTKFEATLFIGMAIIGAIILLVDHYRDMRRRNHKEKDHDYHW